MPRCAKRRRADDGEAAVVSEAAIASSQEKVAGLPLATIQNLLVNAIAAHPELTVEIDQAHDAMIQKLKSKVLNFDSYIKEAWYELNVEHANERGSVQYESAGDVSSNISKLFRTMLTKAMNEHASYGTRRSAAFTMRKILKSVLLAGDVIGKEVRKDCDELGDDFLKLISEGFDAEELDELAAEVVKGVTFLDAVRELAKEADSYCILQQLTDAVMILEEPYGCEDDEEVEGDEEDYGEEEDQAENDEEDDGDQGSS